mgnify:CR=1 FL=1
MRVPENLSTMPMSVPPDAIIMPRISPKFLFIENYASASTYLIVIIIIKRRVDGFSKLMPSLGGFAFLVCPPIDHYS